jgi:UDPglucose 6-dehydrogenase
MNKTPAKTTEADASVIGLGKLGASMLAGMISRGLRVVGVDVSPQVVDAINRGRAPVQETNLDATIRKHAYKAWATRDINEAVQKTPISFVMVPTPSDERGAFSLRFAAEAFAGIGRALRGKDAWHVVVLTSTVLPGATRYGLLPILEKESGKVCGKDFGLCYNPEFIALGSVIHDFLNPDFYLVGEFDARSGDDLAAFHRRVSTNRAPIRRMSLENAEIAKIAVNSFVTLKISFANMLADICERVPGGNVDVVSDAVGTDTRIGRKYLTGGLGFGGPCFPRDNVALAFLGDFLGADTDILKANHAYNRGNGARMPARLLGRIPTSGKAAVLGLAYKPFSHVVEESAGIFLCETLRDAGYSVAGFDPLAGGEAAKVLRDVEVCLTLADCLQSAEIIFVTTPHPDFAALTAKQLAADGNRPHVVDFWRCLSQETRRSEDIIYVPCGLCVDSRAASERLAPLWETE